MTLIVNPALSRIHITIPGPHHDTGTINQKLKGKNIRIRSQSLPPSQRKFPDHKPGQRHRRLLRENSSQILIRSQGSLTSWALPSWVSMSSWRHALPLTHRLQESSGSSGKVRIAWKEEREVDCFLICRAISSDSGKNAEAETAHATNSITQPSVHNLLIGPPTLSSKKTTENTMVPGS